MTSEIKTDFTVMYNRVPWASTLFSWKLLKVFKWSNWHIEKKCRWEGKSHKLYCSSTRWDWIPIWIILLCSTEAQKPNKTDRKNFRQSWPK